MTLQLADTTHLPIFLKVNSLPNGEMYGKILPTPGVLQDLWLETVGEGASVSVVVLINVKRMDQSVVRSFFFFLLLFASNFGLGKSRFFFI